MKFVVEIGKREKVGKRCLNIACTTTSAKCTATPIAWAVVPSQNLKLYLGQEFIVGRVSPKLLG
mgnify:CR=1 FL=1